MLSMKNIHFVLGVLAVFPAASLGQDFCSLTVHIAGASLTTQVPVTVEESDGKRETAYSIDGVARFCGLGLSPVTIRVGRDCAPVTVSGVRPVWGGTRNVDVIYNDSQCREDRVMALGGSICWLLLRFRGDDKNGKPLAGVALRPPAPSYTELRSDQWGRIMVPMRKDEVLHTMAEIPGFVPESIDFNCRSYSEAERVVILRSSH
jgi:hypothetical protein